jgi:hexosaminidase
MRKILFLLCLISFKSMKAQEISIIPQPASMTIGKGKLTISPKNVIHLWGSGLEKNAAFLHDYIKKMYGFGLKIDQSQKKTKAVQKGDIVLNYDKIEHPIAGAYHLSVTDEKIYIGGDNATGVFYGIQSLIQLLPTNLNAALTIPQLTIADKPRFGYRGMHLDVGRHFFSINFIKKYIDFIAAHKMNTFHWHLTEDQGWRIEIKKYPKLTTIGATRNGTTIGRYPGTGNTNIKYSGYYTQKEIKGIIQYATDRFVEIIPEIELPGHSSAAIAAYPELSCFPNESTKYPAKTAWNGPSEGKQVQQTWGVFEDVFCPSETTFQFLENVFDEVIALFPSKYIHIGGDECPKESWKRSAFCQELIKEKNLKDEHGLQSYFIQRIERYLNSKGKQIIGWDEILEGGLAPNATVMSWRGEKGGIEAAKQQHNVIMTPGDWVYFDHAQNKKEDSVTIGGFTDLQKVYSYEPIPKGLSSSEEKYVLGAQANLWTEYITNVSKAEYMLFPRMSALSEVLWSPKASKNFTDFQNRMLKQYERYTNWGVNYNKPAK